MKLQTLFVAIVLFLLVGALQARSLHHQVSEGAPISPRAPELQPIDSQVRLEHPEFAQARILSASVEGMAGTQLKLYWIQYVDNVKFYDVIVASNP